MTATTIRALKIRNGTVEYDIASTHTGHTPATLFGHLAPLFGRCVERLANRHDGAEDWFFEADDHGPIEYRVSAELVNQEGAPR